MLKISKGWKIFLGIIVGGAIIYCGIVFYLVQKMKYEINATKEMLLKLDFSCPEGTKDVALGGGKTGAVRYCEKSGKKHGRFIRGDSRKVVAEGYYHEDKQSGIWKTYHNDGRVYRQIEYKDGIEISDKIINP